MNKKANLVLSHKKSYMWIAILWARMLLDPLFHSEAHRPCILVRKGASNYGSTSNYPWLLNLTIFKDAETCVKIK